MKIGYSRGAAHALLLVTMTIALAACGGGGNSAGTQSSGAQGAGGQGSNAPGTLVPDLVGTTQQAADTTLSGAGLKTGTVTMQASSSAPTGTVISESPAAGTSVASGSSVALTVSSGPAQVAVPDVVGNAQSAASSALTSAGLKVGTITNQASNTVAAGNVISESPSSGTQVAPGSAVDLVVSSGSNSGHTVGGIVIGLGSGLTATVTNGSDQVVVQSVGLAAGFTLPTLLASGTTYSVGVTSSVDQSCAVQNGSGTMGGASLTNIVVYCTNRVSVNSMDATYKVFGYDISADKDWLFSDLFDGQGSAVGHGSTNVNTVITPGVGDSSFYGFDTFTTAPELDDGASNEGGLSANTNAFTWMGNTMSGLQPQLVVGIVPSTTVTLASLAGTWVSASLNGGPTVSGALATNIIGADGSLSGSAVSLSSTGVTASQSLSSPVNTYAVDGNGQVSAGGANGASGYVSTDGNLLVMTYVTGSGSAPGLTIAVRQASGLNLGTFQGVYAMVSLGGTGPASSAGQHATLFAYGDGTYSTSWLQNLAGTTSVGTETGTYTLGASGSLVLTSSTGTASSGQISADGSSLVLAHTAATQVPQMTVALRQ
jgi:hypothetical protein